MKFFILVLTLYFIRTLRNLLYQIFLWQLKEYRLDRMLAHLRTPLGRKLIISPLSAIKRILFFIFLILFAYTLVFGHDLISGIFFHKIGGLLLIFSFFVLPILIYIFEGLLNIFEIITRGWRIPRWTLKSVFIFLISVTIILLLSSLTEFWRGIDYTNLIITSLLIDNLLALIVLSSVIILNIPAYVLKQVFIFLARKKILKMNNLITIGITGSYGKTSTKEFLAAILSEKFKVAKTPEFTNTDIGIAKYILKELTSGHNIFIVEMGAYKKGEIKTICDMVKPKFGVITGINEQHLELFGSIENTKRAKFELIESLPKDGVAIFNGNNIHCLEMAKWIRRRILKTVIYNTDSNVKNIEIFRDHIAFNLISESKSYKFRTSLLGVQSIENLLSAVYVAKDLGMIMGEIQKATSYIVSPLKTMQFKGMENGATLIDDTFNANPDGVLAAVDYMKIFKGKKILVLTPLIELGEEAEKIHERLGEKTAKTCDLILLTNLNYNESFIDGAKKISAEEKVQIVNTSLGVKLVRENFDKDGVIIFEGKEAGRILHQLTNSLPAQAGY
ncbi:UDP-N-acetylmuramoyl-tripeptide--D-alanyl-D-alanine ligase [Candidatus Gottesmanbacteria bacterium]|nr:UDP-N-acetylmuramoyl-tripeptide--D-alanyl-D-alanine ligase [Candidatus Gottesmanbacteria bacterium]